MFTWAIIAIETVSAVALIFLVLLHSGRGGGISDLMGGSMGAAATGSTVVERNLDRSPRISCSASPPRKLQS